MKRKALYLIVAIALFPTALAAEYKSEFKMSIVVSNETAWGRAAGRFADAVKFRTHGRIQIKPYFNGHLFAGKQATEFLLLQQGNADFAIGSTINWSPQVKELNLFALPFMFQSYKALDAVETGDPPTVQPLADGPEGCRPDCLGGERLPRVDELQAPDPSARGSSKPEDPRGWDSNLC